MRKLLGQFALAMGMLWATGVVLSFLAPKENPVTETVTVTTAKAERELCVELLVSDRVQVLSLEEYVTGVLISEMPASFHMEAKKAQALAARTFALNTMETGIKHGAGRICADPGCCQGYLSKTDYLRLGGTEEGLALAHEAAQQTRGRVITYNGALIDATYFSCSGGRTEAAVAVWGADIPYLQAVDSPGEEDAAFYTDTVQFTPEQFRQSLGVRLAGEPKSWFGDVTYTEGDGVETMVIGGKVYSGAELRLKLGLRSQSFTVMPLSDSLLITTRGWGHRVGLSQYGADAMARAGFDHLSIIYHYYQGVTVEEYEKRA